MWLEWHLLRVTLFSCPEGVAVSGEDCTWYSQLQMRDENSLIILAKGRYLNDVRTEGGGLKIAQFCGRTVMIGCVKCG